MASISHGLSLVWPQIPEKGMLLFTLFGYNLSDESFLYGIFGLVIFVFLLLDLGIFNKTAHRISTKSALYQSIFWVFISTVFGYLIYAFDKESGNPLWRRGGPQSPGKERKNARRNPANVASDGKKTV